ncbi:AtpZ/AtpI family protein [Candidatus Peregrinibacteria bacterium]|nr:AtpZ/AtpI family protein [Candidatus Peregrinibacteria bacterium]
MSDPQSSWRPLLLALRLAWAMGYIIAIPAVVLGFGGAYLDRVLGTSPLFIFIGFGIATTVSFLGIKRRIQEIEKEDH